MRLWNEKSKIFISKENEEHIKEGIKRNMLSVEQYIKKKEKNLSMSMLFNIARSLNIN